MMNNTAKIGKHILRQIGLIILLFCITGTVGFGQDIGGETGQTDHPEAESNYEQLVNGGLLTDSVWGYEIQSQAVALSAALQRAIEKEFISGETRVDPMIGKVLIGAL